MKNNAKALIAELTEVLIDYLKNSDLDLNEINFCIEYAHKQFIHDGTKENFE